VARLFVYRGQEWTILPLDHSPIDLTAEPLRAVLARKIENDKNFWTLIVSRDQTARVNGDAVALGICALRDRDTIELDGEDQFYFSTDSPPFIASYPGNTPVPCARCSTDIRPGDLSVRCPKCGAYLHQRQDLECWLQFDECICRHSTAMNEEKCWSPEGI
jgi:hypothetical protein